MSAEIFQYGKIYNRQLDLHNLYGGNRQSGISPSAKYPYVFIFTYYTGKQHGYYDQWINEDVFEYTGHGQIGDMEFKAGNAILRDHKALKKRVFLFSSEGKGLVRFEGELEYFNHQYFETLDSSSMLRLGIKFYFKRIGTLIKNEVSLKLESIDLKMLKEEILETEAMNFVKSRIGQNLFRQRVIFRWNGECAVTKFNHTRALVASHILPWAESDNIQRLDTENGILLSPTYNSLFDLHLISFEDNGKIILSDNISMKTFNTIKVNGQETISGLSQGNKNYLELHRKNLR